MFSVEERLASFAIASSSTSTSTAKKRQSTKATASSLSWPHPVTGRSVKSSGIPTPAILAQHGFYHSPTAEAPDSVTHFLYPDVHIAHWQSGDDPLARLEDEVPANGWCRIFRSHARGTLDKDAGKWMWDVEELLPTSKQMIQARKESFGSQWPYDGKKGWKPTSKKLAEAGFHFTPTQEEPDNAKCIYCDKSLGGWEKSDDPVHEHQRRNPDCAFFNCQLSEPDQEPVESAEPAATEEQAEAIVNAKGKRAVSVTTRKASTKLSKAKAAAMAAAVAEEEEAVATDTVMEEATQEEPIEAAAEPARKKAGRATRTVSTRRKTAAQQDAEEETGEEPVRVEAEAPIIRTESSKKGGASGLGNGNPATTARPTRAASRRATKAIGLLADEDMNKKLRRPDEEDLKRRELALSDPIPFPTAAASEDKAAAAAPETDPAEPSTKPKRSRSKTKKLDKEPEPEPEPEEEEEEEEEEVQAVEDNTVIEISASEAEEEAEAEPEPEPEPVQEEPKRRGGRGGGKSGTASTSTSRKASSKVEAGLVASVDSVVFPSMSSEAEADDVSTRKTHSSGSVSVSNSVAADVDVEVAELPNVGSQSTIRGSSAPVRQALTQLNQLTTLDLDQAQRQMTLGEWLMMKADAAANEMLEAGEAQLVNLENQVKIARSAAERRLRGRA